MWSKIAEEMAVSWRAAEATHWQLGEADMARHAGVVPFSLSSVTVDAPPPNHRSSPSRGHSSSSALFSRPGTAHSASSSTKGNRGGSARTIAARRDSPPRSVPPASSSDDLALAAIGERSRIFMGLGRGSQLLPSVAEMTTGVSPHSTPSFAMSIPMGEGSSE